jgi:hypothetical protein
VLADEGPAPAERLGVTLGQDRVVRQLPPGLAGVAEQHADAAVDVEPGVGQGRAGARRQRVQLRPVLAQQLAECLEQPRPLMEGQLAQRRAAGAAPVGERRAQVDARRRHPRDFLAGHRVEYGPAPVGRLGPCPVHVAAQNRHLSSLAASPVSYATADIG